MIIDFNIINNIKNKYENINIISTPYLTPGTLMVQNILNQLGIYSEIIFIKKRKNIDFNNNNLYIIIFIPEKNILPKNYIFWQIEQTSLIESPTYKFDAYYINKMNDAQCIFEISPDNIDYYKNKISDSKKILYNQLPFYDIYKLNNFPINYEYDICFFGNLSTRRNLIINKLNKKIGNQYKIKVLFNTIGHKRDYILNRSKYVLNIHYYEDAKLECDRFNIAINCNCLILSENCIGDVQNKLNYDYFVKFFNIIDCKDKTDLELNIDDLISVIEYNLKDEVYFENRKNYFHEKEKLQDSCIHTLYKNILQI
jgi:hypothetical protein